MILGDIILNRIKFVTLNDTEAVVKRKGSDT